MWWFAQPSANSGSWWFGGEELEIARTCGHTRLPLCAGDLDRRYYSCEIRLWNWASRVKSIYRQLPELSFTCQRRISSVSTQKMMKWKVHMAGGRRVRRNRRGLNFGKYPRRSGGWIQDEFDVEKLSVIRLGDGKWKISGLTPVHVPEELGLGEQDEELATFGGLITRELAKSPNAMKRSVSSLLTPRF